MFTIQHLKECLQQTFTCYEVGFFQQVTFARILQRSALLYCSHFRSSNKGLARAMVFNLAGGAEPRKFHHCVDRTLREWKNKI